MHEVDKYRKVRPDLIPVSDDEFEMMKSNLISDIERMGYSDMIGEIDK